LRFASANATMTGTGLLTVPFDTIHFARRKYRMTRNANLELETRLKRDYGPPDHSWLNILKMRANAADQKRRQMDGPFAPAVTAERAEHRQEQMRLLGEATARYDARVRQAQGESVSRQAPNTLISLLGRLVARQNARRLS
jgi:hypothetical protein